MNISILVSMAVAFMVTVGSGIFILISRGAWVPRPLAKYYARKSLSQFAVVVSGEPSALPVHYVRDWRIDNFLRPEVTGPFEKGRPGYVRSVFDVSGRVIFYDLTIRDMDGNRELRVRAAANFALGVPIISIGVNAPLPIETWIESARSTAKAIDLIPIDEGRKYPADKNPAVVCYSFPLLGLLCRCAKTGKRYVIRLDTRQSFEVDGVLEQRAQSGSVRDGGHMVSSPLDFPSHWSVPRNLVRHAAYAHVLAATPSIENRKTVSPLEENILDIPNIPQEKSNYCAPATAQMILSYDFSQNGRRFDKSQDSVADAMNVPTNGVDGVEFCDQQRGYALITNNEFFAETDRTPEFCEARDEIDRNRPLVSRIDGHIRAAIGWSKKHPHTGMAGNFILINDPLPVNKGEVRWEYWMGPMSNRLVTHYFYVRPQMPSAA